MVYLSIGFAYVMNSTVFFELIFWASFHFSYLFIHVYVCPSAVFVYQLIRLYNSELIFWPLIFFISMHTWISFFWICVSWIPLYLVNWSWISICLLNTYHCLVSYVWFRYMFSFFCDASVHLEFWCSSLQWIGTHQNFRYFPKKFCKFYF